MTNEIDILDRFLQEFSPEVGGRSSETLTPAMESKLRLLSTGELPWEAESQEGAPRSKAEEARVGEA